MNTNLVWILGLAQWLGGTPVPCGMTTTISTNVVSGDNRRGCSTCAMLRANPTYALYHPFHDGGIPYAEPTEWWTATNVIQTRTFTIQADPLGAPYTFTTSQINWSVTNWTHKAEQVVPGRLPTVFGITNTAQGPQFTWSAMSNLTYLVLTNSWTNTWTLEAKP